MRYLFAIILCFTYIVSNAQVNRVKSHPFGCIYCDGDTLKLIGNLKYEDTFWDDLTVSGTSLASGVEAPTLRPFIGGINMYAYNYAVKNDISYGQGQLKHSYSKGTDIRAHCHIAIEDTPSPGDSVYIALEYTWVNIDDTTTSSDTLYVQQDVSSWAPKQHKLVNFGILDGTGMKESSIILFRFTRLQSNAKDTYSNWLFLQDIDFHFEINKPGSNDYIPD